MHVSSSSVKSQQLFLQNTWQFFTVFLANSSAGLCPVEMAGHANGGEATPATAVKDATAAPAPGGREVDFKKLSQPDAFKLLKVGRRLRLSASQPVLGYGRPHLRRLAGQRTA